jgi:hypothetical protein
MATVQSLCHRAILLHEGELKYIGDPEDTALRYYRLNFAQSGADDGRPPGEPGAVMDVNVRVVEATLRDKTGAAISNVEQGVPIEVDLVFEAARELAGPIFVFHVVNEDGVVVFAFTRTLDQMVGAGQRIRLRGRLENRLVAGRYYLDCWVRQDEHQSMMALQALRVLRLVVFGTAPRHGVVTLNADIEPVVEP